MVKTKDIKYVVDKWHRRASAATSDYEYGVKNTDKDWAANLKARKNAILQAIQQAFADGRFERGIDEVGHEGWKKATLEKGVARYTSGIEAGKSKYEAKMSKVLDIIRSVELPEKGPRGDPRNWERSKVLGMRLHEAKVKGEI